MTVGVIPGFLVTEEICRQLLSCTLPDTLSKVAWKNNLEKYWTPKWFFPARHFRGMFGFQVVQNAFYIARFLRQLTDSLHSKGSGSGSGDRDGSGSGDQDQDQDPDRDASCQV